MKKSILNLGKALNRAEQKLVNGGRVVPCAFSDDPSTDWCCHLKDGCP